MFVCVFRYIYVLVGFKHTHTNISIVSIAHMYL